MNSLSPALAWALLGEIAVIALLSAGLAFWRARRLHQQRYAALESLLTRMQAGQEARVTRKAEWLHSTLGLPLSAAQEASERSAAAEREFLNAILQPILIGTPDLSGELDRLLYQFSDRQLDALLQAVSSRPPPIGPDSDLLSAEVDDDDPAIAGDNDAAAWSEQLEAPAPEGLQAEQSEDESPFAAEPAILGPEIFLSEAATAFSAETNDDFADDTPAPDLEASDVTEAPPPGGPGNATPDPSDEELPEFTAAQSEEPSGLSAPMGVGHDMPRTQEEIDADIAASLRELEAAMGEPSSPAAETQTRLDDVPDTRLADLPTPEEVETSDPDITSEAAPDFDQLPEPVAIDETGEPSPADESEVLPDSASQDRDDKLESLLSGPWSQPEIDIDLAPGLIETEAELDALGEAADGEPDEMQLATQPEPWCDEEPVSLAESMESLLTDIWSEVDTAITTKSSDDAGTLKADDTSLKLAEDEEASTEHADGPDQPSALGSQGDQPAEKVVAGLGVPLLSETGIASLPSEDHVPEPAEKPEAQPPEANRNIQVPPAPEADTGHDPLSPASEAPEASSPTEKRSARKSKPRSKKQKAADTTEGSGSPD